MATDVISSLAGSLDAELEKARENLRGVDSNLKKLFGKDAADFNSFNRGSQRTNRRREDYDRHDDEPGEKRRRLEGGRPAPVVIGPRIRPRFDDDEYEQGQNQGQGRRLQSRIVSSAKEKSREEVLAEQSKDRLGRDRNRRMFGALLGTLQRFKQEETKLKPKEEKRAQIEAKLDEAAKKEREEVKKERIQLIRERKLQMTEIKRLEIKRRRLAELEQWENKTRYLTNFIRTEAKPHVFYMPKVHNPITECRLDESKQFVTEMIASKRKLVLEDLEEFEQRSRRYWENRVDGVDGRNRKGEVDPMDEDIEYELKEIMKQAEAEDEAEDFTVTVIETTKQPIKVIEEQEKMDVEKEVNEEQGIEEETASTSKDMDEDREVQNETIDDGDVRAETDSESQDDVGMDRDQEDTKDSDS